VARLVATPYRYYSLRLVFFSICFQVCKAQYFSCELMAPVCFRESCLKIVAKKVWEQCGNSKVIIINGVISISDSGNSVAGSNPKKSDGEASVNTNVSNTSAITPNTSTLSSATSSEIMSKKIIFHRQ
jgi:hypothetical protein